MTVLADLPYRRPDGQRLQSDPLPVPPPAPAVRPPRRSSVLIATAAVLGALWLGLTAPAVSPVAGPPPVAQAVAPATAVQDVAPPSLVQPPAVVQPPVVPAVPVIPAVPGGRGGRGRR